MRHILPQSSRCARRLAALALGVSLATVPCVTTVSAYADESAQNAYSVTPLAATGAAIAGGMPVVITELAVNTGNTVGGVDTMVDAGEYIELTNMGAEPVNISDLSLTYNGVDWTPEAFESAAADASLDVAVQPGASIVLWDNFAQFESDLEGQDLAACFNAFWQDASGVDPQLQYGVNLFTVSKGEGMANGSARTLVLTRKSTGATNTVGYDGGGAADTTLNLSYDANGVGTLSTDNSATPGSLVEGQKPESWPVQSDRETIITDVSELPEVVYDTDAITLKAQIAVSDGNEHIASVALQWKTDTDTDYVDSNLAGTVENDVWSFAIPSGTFAGKGTMAYRFVVTDDEGLVTTQEGAQIALSVNQSGYEQALVPLVITEMDPNSANVGGADGYEFIEVTNVSDQTVDFSDAYTIYYSYPEQGDAGDVEWGADQADIKIAAGDSAVFWIKNGSNDDLTDTDFNNEFDLTGEHALTMGKDLFTIHSAGMSNSSARLMKISTKTKTLVSSAAYTADSSGSNTLRYVYAGGTNESTLASIDQPATPGSVAPSDIRATAYTFPQNVTAPDIADSTPSTFGADEDVTFTFDVRCTGTDVKRVTLYTRTSGESGYTSHNLVKAAGSDTYSYVMNKIDLIRKASIEYYVEASNGIGAPVQSEPKTIVGTDYDDSEVRLNMVDGQFLRGEQAIRATGADKDARPSISIDGEPVGVESMTASLESEPYIAAEITQTDIFFYNSFTRKLDIQGTPSESDWQENVIGSFDDGTYGDTATVSFPVPLDMVEDNTIKMYMNAGTKSSATDILSDGTVNSENADNYQASNIRLVLPDGTTLHASKATAGVSPGTAGKVTEEDVTEEVANPANSIKIGDSSGQYEYILLEFEIPETSVAANQYLWDTTTVADGEHTVSAEFGANRAEATVTVDNTKPVITPDIADEENSGKDVKRGTITIDAEASDITSGIAEGSLGATLANGQSEAEPIELPYTTSSVDLPAGEHTVTFTVSDNAGNTTSAEVTFTTPEEDPTITAVESQDGAEPTLSVSAADESNDELGVTFYRGEAMVPGETDKIASSQGTTRQSGVADGTQGTALSAEDAAKLNADDKATVTTTAEDAGFPYQSFTVKVPESLAADATASTTIRWNGSAEAGSDLYAFVRNVTTGAWDQVARVQANGKGKATIEQNVANADHVADGAMTVVIQNGAGYAPGDLTAASSLDGVAAQADGEISTINGVNGEPVISMTDDPISQADTPRQDYDFTFAWESDTQYYNANYDDNGYFEHQKNIHTWLLENRDRMNISYMFHTGDVVDNAELDDQWARADEQYRRLDEAGFPYGVLAGNHDVDHKTEDYTQFSARFGENRYNSNPWYGGSYKNNKGHYDLVSAGGIDFIMVYMGWGIGDEEIEWMNDVLARYPDRVAILNFHEYLLASGGLGLIPQEVYQRVVAPNENVKMVLSGHYHSAQKTVSQVDTDGDGVADRNVVNMLFDYQGMEEGGKGYLRLMHVNTADGTMSVRTYSPSLNEYGSESVATSEFAPSDEEFVIHLNELGIDTTQADRPKTLTTDSFRVDVLGGEVIGTALIEPAQSDSDDVRTASIVWKDAPEGVQGWYAKVTSPYGGSATSAVDYVTVGAGAGEQQPSDGQQPSGGQQSSSSDRPDGEKPADTGAGVMVPTVIAAVALLIAGSCMALRSRGGRHRV